MHGVSARDLAGREKPRNIEIAFARRRRPNAYALVSEPDVHRIRIGGGMHGNRCNAEFFAGALDAQRDFTAIGNQDFVEHRRSAYSMIMSGSPYSTGWPFSTRMRLIVPALGDGIWFIVFMASTIRSVCPSRTTEPTSTNVGAP